MSFFSYQPVVRKFDSLRNIYGSYAQIMKKMDDGKFVAGLKLDFLKAFHTEDTILLTKLSYYDIRGVPKL